MLIQILLEKNIKTSELCNTITKYPQTLINVKVENSKKTLYLENKEIQEKIQSIEKEFKDNGRVIIRPSGTEPLIRVMIEGQDEQIISQRAKELANLIKIKLN